MRNVLRLLTCTALLLGVARAQVTPPVEGTPPGLTKMPVLYPVQPGTRWVELPRQTTELIFSARSTRDGWAILDEDRGFVTPLLRDVKGRPFLQVKVPASGRWCGLIWSKSAPDTPQVFCFVSDPKGYPAGKIPILPVVKP